MLTRREMGIGLAALPTATLAGNPQSRIDAPPVWGPLTPGRYRAGYAVDWIADPLRAAQDGGGGARMIQRSLWYPAAASARTVVTIGDYARMLAERTPRTPPSWPARAAAQMALTLPPGLPERSERLAAVQAFAQGNAPHATGRFPLVLFGQGLFFESPLHQFLLAEYLASHGFVVATAPLTGASSVVARLAPDDLEAQIRDLEFIASGLKAAPFLAEGAIGFFGWDMGGMAGLALAGRNPQVKSLVCFDSGIASPSHVARFLDRDFSRLDAPLFHISRPLPELAARGLKESLALIESLGWVERAVVRVPGMRHADFSIHAMIETVLPEFWGPPPGKPHQSYPPLAQLALAAFDAALRGGSRETLSAQLSMLDAMILPADPTAPSFDRLSATALTGEPAQLAAMLAAASDEALRRLGEDSFVRLGAELLYRRTDRTRARLVIDAGLRAFPQSEALRSQQQDAA